LSQVQDGVERVIAYGSRSLTMLEKKYSATELECLAILYAVEPFRPYVYGRKFTIVTDHCSLCWLLNLRDPNGRLARWALRLQPYDYKIVYKSGKTHKDADFFSRNPVDIPLSDADPLDISENLCQMSVNTDVALNLYSLHFNDIRDLQALDKRLSPIIEAVKHREFLISSQVQDETPNPIALDYSLRDGILYKANNDDSGRMWLLCIPSSMREGVLAQIHAETLNHLGIVKTYACLKSRYYWPIMYTHCLRHVRSCKPCQFYNRRNFNVPGPLLPIPPPLTPFYRIGIDYQGPFPQTHPYRNQYVFVVVDHLTRYVVACPTKSCDSASAIAALENLVIFKHSCPREILADRGTSFTSHVFKAFRDKYKIKLLLTAAYKPDTNGVCERQNDVIKKLLSTQVNESHTNWDKFVNKAAWTINISTHKVTDKSPYQLLYGRDPFLPCDTQFPTVTETLTHDDPIAERTRHKIALADARRKTIKFEQLCKAKFDQKHPQRIFYPGDLVLFANFKSLPGLVRKWLPKWIGPCKVKMKTSPNNYLVEDMRSKPNLNKTLRIVSVRHLKLYFADFQSNTDCSNTISSPDRTLSHRISTHSSLKSSITPTFSFKSKTFTLPSEGRTISNPSWSVELIPSTASSCNYTPELSLDSSVDSPHSTSLSGSDSTESDETVIPHHSIAASLVDSDPLNHTVVPNVALSPVSIIVRSPVYILSNTSSVSPSNNDSPDNFTLIPENTVVTRRRTPTLCTVRRSNRSRRMPQRYSPSLYPSSRK